jgi:hypothetical protein
MSNISFHFISCEVGHPALHLISTHDCDEMQSLIDLVQVQVYLQQNSLVQGQVYLHQNKKKTEAESKNCHTKTMLSLEKPIKLT